MNELISILIAAVPGVEAMWASAYMLCNNTPLLIPLAIFMNFLGVVVFITLVEHWKMPDRVESFFRKRSKNALLRFEKWFTGYGFFVLFVLIALPFTGIGSYTGAFIGRTLGLRRIKLYAVVLCGIALSVVFAYMISYGVDLIGFHC